MARLVYGTSPCIWHIFWYMRHVVYGTFCICDILYVRHLLLSARSDVPHRRLSYLAHHFKWHSMIDVTFYFADIFPNIFNSTYNIILHRMMAYDMMFLIGIWCSDLVSFLICACHLMPFRSHLLSSSRTRKVWWWRAGSVWELLEFDVSWSNSWDMRAPRVSEALH